MTRGVIVAMAAVSLMLPAPASAQPADLEEQVRTYFAPYVEMDHFAGTVLIAAGRRRYASVYDESFVLERRTECLPPDG